MSVIIFIVVLGVLIFIHELGHFLVAKRAGIRVDEFAIGFPPRIFSIKKGETQYSLNLIPFGGYVKIFGESPEGGADDKNATDSLLNKPKSTQALVMVAGIVFNMILACVIFSFLFVRGVEFDSKIVPYVQEKSEIRVQHVVQNSIAQKAGLEAGDTIQSIRTADGKNLSTNDQIMSALYDVKKTQTTISFTNTKKEAQVATLTPQTPEDKFGISLSDTVYIKTNPIKAVQYGFLATGHLIKLTAVGLFDFFGNLVTGKADFKEISGPVGIVGLVDQAAKTGLNEILILTAIISINLGVLNIMPFPALDGGRLFIIGIEAILRRDLDHKKVALINLIGFGLLLALMMLLTVHDIKNLFN